MRSWTCGKLPRLRWEVRCRKEAWDNKGEGIKDVGDDAAKENVEDAAQASHLDGLCVHKDWSSAVFRLV
jgi:hypothetical protein